MRFVKLVRGGEAYRRGLIDLEEWSRILDEPLEFLKDLWWIVSEEEFEETTLREKGFRRKVCEPIAIIVNNRLYLEKAKAWIKDDIAYMKEKVFEELT